MRSINSIATVPVFLVAAAFPSLAEPAKIDVETVLIKGATFKMGTSIKKERDAEYHADEAPIEVSVRDFRIGNYPVTAEQMCSFLNSAAAKKHDLTSLYNHRDLGYAYSQLLG